MHAHVQGPVARRDRSGPAGPADRRTDRPARCIVTASHGDNTIAESLAGSRTRPMGRGGQSAATFPLVGQPDPLPHAPSPGPFSRSLTCRYNHNHKSSALTGLSRVRLSGVHTDDEEARVRLVLSRDVYSSMR